MNHRQTTYDPLLIQAIASGKSVAQAAKEAGISRATAFRRLQEQHILRAVDERRAALTEVAVDELVRATGPACATMRELLADESSNVRLSAARSIVDRMMKLRSLNELEARLREVESEVSTNTEASVSEQYWPVSYDKGPPCVVSLSIPHGYRHTANWLDFILYHGGLTDEQVQDINRQITDLRESARKFDESLAS